MPIILLPASNTPTALASASSLPATAGAFQDPLGVVAASGKLVFDLSQAASIAGGGGIAPKRVTISLDVNGNVAAGQSMFRNTDLLPAGTTYGMQLFDSGGNFLADYGAQSIQGAAPIDLALLVPTSTSGGIVSFPAPVLQNPLVPQTITGQPLTITSDLTAGSVNAEVNPAFQTGATVSTQINAAVASFGSTSGVIRIPSTMGAGEGNQAPDTVILIDERGGAVGQGLRFNITATNGGNIRQKIRLQDNFNASTIGLGAGKGSATFYIPVFVDRPEVSSAATIEAFNASMFINSQLADTTATIVGIEGEAAANATNASPRNVADMRGGTFNVACGGNTTCTNAYGLVAQKPAGTGIVNAYSLMAESPTVGSGDNYAIWSKGNIQLSASLLIPSGIAGANIQIGTVTAQPGAGVFIRPQSTLSGTSQVGIQSAPITSSAATLEGSGGFFRADTAVAVYVQTVNTGIHIQQPTVGAGSTITEWNGIRIDVGSPAGTTNLAIKSLSTAGTFLAGVITTYNNITLVGNGVPSQVATVDLTGQTAAVGTTTLYAIPANGQYRLNWNAKVTTAAGVSSQLGGLTIVYTDPDGIAVSLLMAGQLASGGFQQSATANTTGTVMIGFTTMLNCKSGTNVTYAMAYASNAANAMTYNLHIRLESL